MNRDKTPNLISKRYGTKLEDICDEYYTADDFKEFAFYYAYKPLHIAIDMCQRATDRVRSVFGGRYHITTSEENGREATISKRRFSYVERPLTGRDVNHRLVRKMLSYLKENDNVTKIHLKTQDPNFEPKTKKMLDEVTCTKHEYPDGPMRGDEWFYEELLGLFGMSAAGTAFCSALYSMGKILGNSSPLEGHVLLAGSLLGGGATVILGALTLPATVGIKNTVDKMELNEKLHAIEFQD